MALDTATIKNTYPLPVYNYRVSIGNEAVAFSEVSGLSIQYELITYKHGLSWKEGADYMPGMRQPLRITLKKGLVIKGQRLYQWINTVYQRMVVKQDLLIELCDETGTAVITWQVHRAFPLKLDAPAFNAASNDVAIETMELVAESVAVTYHTPEPPEETRKKVAVPRAALG